ncbi:MAG: STAS domain-containing protein [Eubacterium sp.]|nr:STAS domain-containing protein [Eubacterium sp.]
MLNITTEQNGSEVTILLDGRLDKNSSVELREEIYKYVGSSEKIILDLEKLIYISSAGLRVFLETAQDMEANGGELNVRKLTSEVWDIFEMTGFLHALTVI